ncbi:unnamed protein product [Kuraishia capsulata CBS 1993]|uniref:ABC transporter domain-containing protein n=1 Tax=Kuraishia capsulata CBS 1993 TaxID=1382522 RepID=W6MGZ4_9ASCO|nr:uncharacterized protein KUCA_T00001148001 [Kuraishia capsulata CBS 1993]CDK25181.1 unnamed protein product [Kuraishia capsulata CBS 1993]
MIISRFQKLLLVFVFVIGLARTESLLGLTENIEIDSFSGGADGDDTGKCPVCFNCNLADFECKQFSTCNKFTGRCECVSGFGGDDCSQPLCGGLGDGINRPGRGDDQKSCACEDGWDGINCNVCTEDSVCDSFLPGDLKGTCYQQGIIVKNFHQMCDVTNKKIVAILDGKKPQVTFNCNKTSEACNFQFWIAEKESFYCELSKCAFDYSLGKNSTHYQCEEVSCKCLPDRMLCGEAGSIDISDFLTETIRGPGEFTCDVAKRQCKFSEPSMNDLITNVFGDPYITLECNSGECIHSSEIPGFVTPDKPRFSWRQLATIAGAIVGCGVVIGLAAFGVSKSPLFATTGISLSESDDDADADASLLANERPATFSFEKVCYSINGKEILKDAFGVVKSGECLAIMGGSGAGKTTLLDILAGKNKGGEKSSCLYINGEKLTTKEDLYHFKKNIGFVDQEDYLIPTLTVYETVLNSALLRLPRRMSFKTKHAKVIQILAELRILHVKDKLIGSDFERGISGGEKRRVAIACELVTSPSILFLDEPTSGLDAFNAHNVVESLVRLARDFKSTIIFTIHQPRSNIVSLFDKLLLLSEGNLVYSGEMLKCNEFFSSNGYKCPPGYNIADYLIDITSEEKSPSSEFSESSAVDFGFEEATVHTDIHTLPVVTQDEVDDPTSEWEHYAVHRDEFNNSIGLARNRNSKVTSTISTKQGKINTIFQKSSLAEEVLNQIRDLQTAYEQNSREASVESGSFFKVDPGHVKAGFFTQLLILCSRTFKNSYRNPRLLMGHYILSIIMGLFCSYLYYDIKNDISGFQNRLGLFFFLLTMFGFSCLTGLHSFSIERIVFIRERSNNYYNPLSYYISKILCDVIPLRLFPPVILLAIIYPLVGLDMQEHKFFKCVGILVLFNLATAVEILIIGILVKEPGAATMIGVLVLLFSLLFAGLFINKETIPIQIDWIQSLSVFHYGYEALSVNEANGLTLKEKKYGLDIAVPGAVILSTFGFDVGAVNFDMWWLGGLLGAFLVVGYIGLHYFVYETR